MVLANVAAAETLLKKKTPLLFRIHEEPSPEKPINLTTSESRMGVTGWSFSGDSDSSRSPTKRWPM